MRKLIGLLWQDAGQVLRETAVKHGIGTSSLEQTHNTTPRIRRHKCRLPGGGGDFNAMFAYGKYH